MEAPRESTADTALFGETFADPIPKAPGSEKNQKGGYDAMMNFRKVMEKQGVVAMGVLRPPCPRACLLSASGMSSSPWALHW